MAHQHKIVITVTESRRTVNIKMRGHGNILGLNLAGYNVTLPRIPIPTLVAKKDYIEAVMELVTAALE